jgi:cell division protein FtsX
MTESMNLNRYLFTSTSRSEVLTALEITISTAAALILGSSYFVSWFSLVLSVGGLLFGVFLVTMFAISLQVSSKEKEVAIMRALGAKGSTILRGFLTRLALVTMCGCLFGALIGYSLASFSVECSLLSIEVVGLTTLSSLVSSFSGGSVAAKRLLHLKIGEVLR